MTFFRDRAAAAARLIEMLPHDIGSEWLVLALPRGGVPIAAAIARHLGADLDLIIVRKVGAPGQPEVAAAAVTGPGPDEIVINERVCSYFRLTPEQIRKLAEEPIREVERRRKIWMGSAKAHPVAGRDVLIVDDGVATGTTLAAALKTARQTGARRVVVAVPVALGNILAYLAGEVSGIICPYPDAAFSSVGMAYDIFDQVDDHEVARLMAENAGAAEE